MKKASPELVEFLASEDSEKIRIADLYSFNLANGTILTYTSADFDIIHKDLIYSCDSACISRSEISWDCGLSVDDVTIELNPSDNNFVGGVRMIEAFRNGTFDGAGVQMDLAFYKNGWPRMSSEAAPAPANKEPLVLENMFSGNVDVEEVSGSYVKLNVKSLTELLNQDFPSAVYQASCSYSLYCNACGVERENHSEENSVESGSTRKKIVCFLSRTGSYYQNGVIEFISGPNKNIKKSIKQQSNGLLELSTPLPFEPKKGDWFIISAGCDKTISMCKQKFNNLANYNGTPFIPKADSSL